MARLTKLEWAVVLECLVFQECNDGDGRPWGSSNDTELTESEREDHDKAMLSAIDKIRRS